MAKAPGIPGLLLISIFSIPGERKLLCNGDLFCFVMFSWLLDLTSCFAGEFLKLFCKLLIIN